MYKFQCGTIKRFVFFLELRFIAQPEGQRPPRNGFTEGFIDDLEFRDGVRLIDGVPSGRKSNK